MPESVIEDAGAESGSHSSARDEPRWLRALAFAAAAAVAAFGLVGLALAVAGIAKSALVFPLGFVAWVGLLALARPMLEGPGARDPQAHAAAGLAVAFAGSMAFWHARHASQHVLINRDGGAYANAGRWIAAHGNLRVVPEIGPFAHGPRSLVFETFGIYRNHDGTLSFQFAHLLPALLAQAHRIGGDRLMFATPALLSGIALLALFLAGWRLLRNPWAALAAMVSFAFVLPEVSFSRDTYSEIPMQVVLFTALWVLADRHVARRPRLALATGLLIGTLQGIRIDALAAMLGLPVLFAVAWVRAEGDDRRSVARAALACAAGLVPGLAVGFTDVLLRSHQYYVALRGNVKSLIAAMVASVVLSIVGALVARRVRIAPGRRARLADVAGVGVALVLVAAWVIRPRVQTTHGKPNDFIKGLQVAAGVPVAPTRTYFEQSMHWMSWYLGPVVVVAGIVAAGFLTCALLRGRQRPSLALVTMLGPASALYLWKASAFPDQVWVMRRFLISALPLLVLLAFGLVVALFRWVPARIPRALPVGVGVVIAAFAIGYPISTIVHVRDMTEQRGDLAVIKAACGKIGTRDAAVVVMQSKQGIVDEWLPQALRDWCDVPVANMRTNPKETATLEHLATSWKAQQRRLWIVAGDGDAVHDALPTVKAVSTTIVINKYFLERTLVRKPAHYVPTAFSLVLAPVPPG